MEYPPGMMTRIIERCAAVERDVFGEIKRVIPEAPMPKRDPYEWLDPWEDR